MKTLAYFIKNNIIFIILTIITILAVFCVFYYKTECYCTIIKNVSYSIIAAYIFYVTMDYIPFVRKKKIMRNLIDMQLSKLYGIVYDCINGVISPFSLNPKIYKDKEDFANDFYSANLEEKIEKFTSNTRKSYLELNKGKIIEYSISILNYREFLSEKELDSLTLIRSSAFLTQILSPRNFDLPDNLIDTYPNNQREIGESIYEIYELMKEIKQ